MAKHFMTPGPVILEAALQGLELQRDKLDEQIAQVRSLLERKPGKAERTVASVSVMPAPPIRKRILSVDARKRIAAAQKKRWAAFRKNQK